MTPCCVLLVALLISFASDAAPLPVPALASTPQPIWTSTTPDPPPSTLRRRLATRHNTPVPAALTVRVDPHITYAPSDLRVIVRIDPHPRNGQYQILIVGDDFATSSSFPLDGDRSPATQSARWFRSLPAGEYQVMVIVYRWGNGLEPVAQVSDRVQILGRN